MKRVLIFYVSIGSGHLSAARAIQTALEQRNPGVQIMVEDLFGGIRQPRGMTDLLSAASTMLIPGIYDWVWRTGAMRVFFRLSAWMPLLRGKILWLTRQFQPDVIVCTHALPCAILALYGRKNTIMPLVAVSTDFDVHPYWPVEGVDAFVVASPQARARLIKRGYPAERIQLSGIPVQTGIKNYPSVPSEQTDELRVLVLAGGGSMGPYLPIIKKIRKILNLLAAEAVPGVSWKFIFGKNTMLLREAQKILDGRADVELLGYVDDVPAQMASADLVISKPGGLALAEALSLGKPVVLLQRGAGQENANTKAVLAKRAGVLLESSQDLLQLIRELKFSPARLSELQANAQALGAPKAALHAAELIEKLVAAQAGEQ